MIGILRWAVELGRIDIAFETVLMSQFSAEPREGHIEAVYGIFTYLKVNATAKIVFDHKTPFIPPDIINNDADWKAFYGDVKEDVPSERRSHWGKLLPFHVSAITRQSHTGILIFLQIAPILWFSKKQNTVESNTWIRVGGNADSARFDSSFTNQATVIWSTVRRTSKLILR
jgi:hypothetical protein